VRVRFGCIEAFGYEWFSLYYFLYSTILTVNFLRVVSASGCQLIKPNYLNLGVLCDCVILFYAIFCFFGDP
jgi:hypothetical protein